MIQHQHLRQAKIYLFFFFFRLFSLEYVLPEAVIWSCSVEKVFLEILHNSQENTCTRVSSLIIMACSQNY